MCDRDSLRGLNVQGVRGSGIGCNRVCDGEGCARGSGVECDRGCCEAFRGLV